MQPLTDRESRDQAENEDGIENSAVHEALMISKLSRDQKRVESMTIDRYAGSSFWKRLRKRLCSSNRFKNLQVKQLCKICLS